MTLCSCLLYGFCAYFWHFIVWYQSGERSLMDTFSGIQNFVWKSSKIHTGVQIFHVCEFVPHSLCQTGWWHLIWLARSQRFDPDLLPRRITQTGGPEAWQSLASQERSVCVQKKQKTKTQTTCVTLAHGDITVLSTSIREQKTVYSRATCLTL